MKLRSLVSAALLMTAAIGAHAQSTGNIGLYFNPLATRISNSQVDPTSLSFLGPTSTSRIFWGFQMGGYYDFIHSGPLSFGATVRFSDQHDANADIRNFQVGARVAGALGDHWHPYVEATVGDGSTKPEKSLVRVSKAAYNVYGGVDYSLARHLDIRAFEIGYGSLTTASESTVGQGNGAAYPASKLLNFSAGFVVRF